ncbi:MAG: ABC transporter permease [Candidatus Latescibacteria bacterium]|nr:ABC transporter permease [Candidatus Latescibacterota bacterium]
MLRNYFIIALRNISRHKAYSFINIAGLVIGLAATFFIVLWIQDELSFNTFLKDRGDVYRVMRHATFGGTKGSTASMPKPIVQVLRDEYPEFTHVALMSWPMDMVLTQNDEVYRSKGRYFGADIFHILKYPLIAGDPDKALRDPESIVISETLALRYFGEDWQSKPDLLGTSFRLDNERDVRLTAVIEDVPSTASLQFEFILPMESYIRTNDWVEAWDNNGLNILARLREGTDPALVEAKIVGLIDDHVDAWETDVFLHPIDDMYLRSKFENGVQVGGRIEYVQIFMMVGLFILLIASINFMNLVTARSMQRAREIGVRKALGATKSLLARQFAGESVLTAIFAFLLAMATVYALLPEFNELTGKSVELGQLGVWVWIQFGLLALVTGLLAGSYPALYLSSLNVIRVLREARDMKAGGGGLRKGLVIFQFSMSIILIIGTLTVYQQLNYIRHKDLGMDRENVVYIDMEGDVREKFDVFKREMQQVPGVMSVASAARNPLTMAGNNTIGVKWEGKPEGNNTLFSALSTDYDFIETMGMSLKDGRLFSPDYSTDSSNYIINEAAGVAMSMETPVGQPLTLWGREGVIVGVVKDFHMTSMYDDIAPAIMRFRPSDTYTAFVRIAPGQTESVMAALESTYKQFNPQYPFSYRFMDDEFDRMYRSETVIGSLASIAAGLAVLIACLGLFGLESFTTEQRTKEIGIRKVLGASVPNIVMMLSKDSIILVVVAYIVAAPIAYYIMSDWLQAFAYRSDLSIGVLAGAGIAAVAIAWLTVSYQAIRAASANPVSSLRSE